MGFTTEDTEDNEIKKLLETLCALRDFVVKKFHFSGAIK